MNSKNKTLDIDNLVYDSFEVTDDSVITNYDIGFSNPIKKEIKTNGNEFIHLPFFFRLENLKKVVYIFEKYIDVSFATINVNVVNNTYMSLGIISFVLIQEEIHNEENVVWARVFEFINEEQNNKLFSTDFKTLL